MKDTVRIKKTNIYNDTQYVPWCIIYYLLNQKEHFLVKKKKIQSMFEYYNIPLLSIRVLLNSCWYNSILLPKYIKY